MKKKVLVCSSEKSTRAGIKLSLGDDSDTILCESVGKCEDIIQQEDVKVLLLDIERQSDVLKEIASLKSNHPTLKIVAVVSPQSLDIGQEAVQNGADGHIIKPLKATELLSICK